MTAPADVPSDPDYAAVVTLIDEAPVIEPEEGAAPDNGGDGPDGPPGPPEPPEGGPPPPDDGDPIDMEVVAACVGLDACDTDNGVRLRRHFPDDLVVRRQEGGRAPMWVAWAGTHWDDVTGAARALALAQRIGPRIAAEAALIAPTTREKALIEAGEAAKTIPKDARTPEQVIAIAEAAAAKKAVVARRTRRVAFGVSSKNSARIQAMLAMAAPHLIVAPERFNHDPLVVCTPGATLRFSREDDPDCPDPEARRFKGALAVTPGHARADMVTRLLPVDYDPAAPRHRFDAFMARFQPDEGLRRFVQVACGLGLLGLTEQVLAFHYGEGANGKSVFLEVIARVLGPLAASLPAESISGEAQRSGAGASPDIARLFGARFVRIAEIPEGTDLQEDLVKKLTGGERFAVRNLFEGFFEFEPQFIAHMSGNGYPRITGSDNGIWRRMAVVKWPVVLAREEQRNFADVVDELTAEAPGILAWLVEGALAYLGEGLVRPDAITRETQAFRDEMDPVGVFLRPPEAGGCVERTGDEADAIGASDLYRAYEDWCGANARRPVNRTRFGRDAVKHLRRVDGRTRAYVGVRLVGVPRNPDRDEEGRRNPREGY